MMPSCDHVGVPGVDAFAHFSSSTTSGSTSLMSARIRVSVRPRQSPSAAIHIVCCSLVALALTTAARADDAVDSAVAHMGFGAGITFNQPTSNDGHSNQ